MAKKIRFQRLEPRILLDAAAGFTLAETTLDDKTDSLVGVQQSSPEPDLQNSETFGYGLAETENNGVILGEVEQTALVVVDTSIDGYESLLTNIDSGTEILLIEGNENGLEVIANYVDGRSDISSIHILSHGDEGSFRLGTATVNAQNIDLYAEALSQIGDSLTEEGDLFFYGCNISGGETGIEFVTELAFYTDADVAASIDLTGAEAEGGDWDLETTIGQLDTESLTFSDFAALLPQDNQDPALLEIVPQDNGNELTLVIDEDNSLDDTIAVPTTAFIVTVNSNAATVSSVSVDATNNTVTLTLADPVSIDDAVVVDYTQQAGLQIQDTAGKFLPSFSSVSMSASPIYFSSDVWTVVAPSGTTQYDYVVDQQTGQAGGDIVGNENESGFYTYFDDNGTGSNTDGDLSLRWRVGAEGNSYYFAGLDANLDGAVDLSVTATAEVVPRQPDVVRAPIEGVIGEVHVLPNQSVAAGDLVLTFDDTSIQAQLDVAEQELAIAGAEYQRANQASVSDRGVASQLPMLKARVEQKRAQLRYNQSLMERSRVYAEDNSIAIVPDIQELEGRPVRMGEKILTLAKPKSVELEFWLAVGDSIPLPTEAEVELFLNVHPDRVHHAKVRYINYQAEVSPGGILGFRGRADFLDQSDLRVGWRGTARVQGDPVFLGYFLFRRPLSVIRQWTGL